MTTWLNLIQHIQAQSPLRVGALGLLFVFGGLHCGKATGDAADARTLDPGAPDAETATTPDAAAPADTDASSDAAPEGSTRVADGSTGLACSEDAGGCDTLPASVCADNTTLLYFSDGTCKGGTCTWTANAMPCPLQSQCVQGGCTAPTTE
jgi:hypothetical protein